MYILCFLHLNVWYLILLISQEKKKKLNEKFIFLNTLCIEFLRSLSIFRAIKSDNYHFRPLSETHFLAGKYHIQ